MILDNDNIVQEHSLEMMYRLRKQLVEGLYVRVPIIIIKYTSEGMLKQCYYKVDKINNFIYRFSKKQQEEIIEYNLPRLYDFFIDKIMKDEPNAFLI